MNIEDYINKLLYLIFLVFSTGSGIYLVLPADESSGSALTQAVLGILYFTILLYYILNYLSAIKILKKYIYLVVLLTWILVSITYSFDFSLSLRRLIALYGTSISAFYFFEKLGFKSLLYYTVSFLGLSLLLSIVFVFLTPTISTSNFHDGAWNGIYTHKNLLGRYSSIALITSIGLLIYNFRENNGYLKKMSMIGVITVSIICLFGSDSLTSIITVIFSLSILLLMVLYKLEKSSYYLVKYIGGGVTIIFVILLFLNITYIIDFVGKDITLTGRTYLWTLLLIISKENILFGYGYSGFWLGENEYPSNIIFEILNWYPSQAHNGYIEVYIQLGLIGLGLFIYFLYKTFKSIKLKNILKNYSVNIVSLMLIVYVSIYNLTEVSFLVPNSFMWFLFLVLHIQLIRSSELHFDLKNYRILRRL